MKIDTQLIELYDKYRKVGSVVASTTALSESGREVLGIRPPEFGSIKGEAYTICRLRFFEVYEVSTRGGCFTLFEMKQEYKDLAVKHARALDILRAGK